MDEACCHNCKKISKENWKIFRLPESNIINIKLRLWRFQKKIESDYVALVWIYEICDFHEDFKRKLKGSGVPYFFLHSLKRRFQKKIESFQSFKNLMVLKRRLVGRFQKKIESSCWGLPGGLGQCGRWEDFKRKLKAEPTNAPNHSQRH